MRGRRVSPETIAAALVEATIIGDKAAAKKHGISFRTLENARADGTAAKEVVAVCGSLRDEIRDGVRRVLRVAIARCERGQEDLSAITETLRVLGELDVQTRVLDESDGSARPSVEAAFTPRRDPLPAHVHLDAQ